MLTKSDNVNNLLNLQHNGHTIVAWSMNNERVSRKFEIGAPSFERRLKAARKVQEAEYPVRIRLDPIVPFDGWKEAYAETIERILTVIFPQRITLRTLRFEEGFYKMRISIFTNGPELPDFLEVMEPMFPPRMFTGAKRAKSGKYSFPEDQRAEIFCWAIAEGRSENTPMAETLSSLCAKNQPRFGRESDCRCHDAVALASLIMPIWNRGGNKQPSSKPRLDRASDLIAFPNPGRICLWPVETY